MIILVDEEGKKVLAMLADTHLKTNGISAHQQINAIFGSTRELTKPETEKELDLRAKANSAANPQAKPLQVVSEDTPVEKTEKVEETK